MKALVSILLMVSWMGGSLSPLAQGCQGMECCTPQKVPLGIQTQQTTCGMPNCTMSEVFDDILPENIVIPDTFKIGHFPQFEILNISISHVYKEYSSFWNRGGFSKLSSYKLIPSFISHLKFLL